MDNLFSKYKSYQMGVLDDFLNGHKADDVFTHMAMNGGKYFIPDDDLPRFYELYTESILDGEKLTLVEKNSDISIMRVDLDMTYDKDIKTHLHTPAQVEAFCNEYLQITSKFLQLPTQSEIYVMEKRKLTEDKKKNKMKSGIHLVFPDLRCHKFVEQRVRRAMLKKMPDFFGSLPIDQKDDNGNIQWEKVYDEGVVNRGTPWTMYKSRKKGKDNAETRPYEISYIFTFNTETGEFQKQTTNIPEVSPTLLHRLSVRPDESLETHMTEEGRILYEGLKEQNVRISGGDAVLPKRGRKLERKDQTSRASSPSSRLVQPLDPTRKNYLKQHVMNLADKRWSDYEEWVRVGICLHNIHPDMLDVFLDFSSQDELKYRELDCIQKWNSFTFKNDGERLGEGTLRYWSREDNKQGYDAIESSNVEQLTTQACSGTEHDIACVIYAKFRDSYKCADFGKNVWYRWSGHIWKETDKGVNLQLKLSKEIASTFFKQATAIANEMSNNGFTSCSSGEKKDCGQCEFCTLEEKRASFLKVFTKLKTTKFKDNVMKECRELFFDEEFTKKIDSNKDLIAFENGILDLITYEFRDGKPEDYISFSTGLDFDPNKHYTSYENWSQIEEFIHQVLPDKEVREYFMKHLASNLAGGNPAQKFHILTGSGSNGKSMISNLMSKAMGDYACGIPIALFTQKRKGSGAAAPEVIRLKGRRYITTQEPDESIALNTGLVKELTSCEKVFARDLFKSGTEFEIQSKFHLSCNDKPKINTTDGGTWRRIVVIWFISKFVLNPNPKNPNEHPMNEQIQTLVESPAWATTFMSYLVHLFKENNGLRKLSAPSKIMEYTDEYRNENDGIAKFMSEYLITIKKEYTDTDPSRPAPVTKQQLRKEFRTWLDENSMRGKLEPQELEKRMEQLHGKYPKGGWTNIQFVEE